MKKIVLLTIKWILFVAASALASLVVFETINVTPGIQTSSLKISFMLLAWIGWGAISVYNSKQESLEGFSKSHQVLHHIVYFFLLMAVFGATLSFVFLSYNTIFPSPILPPPPSSLTSVNMPSPAVPAEGFGTPHVFTPDMYQPVAYKSDDFNGAIQYDVNYDPEKDELLQFMNALQDKVYNSETHNYKEAGGALALGTGKEDVEWQTAPGQPKKTLEGRTFGMGGADSMEKQQAKNYFKENGFTANALNSTAGIAAYTKDKFICLYQENLPLDDFQFKCAMIGK